MRGEFPKHLTRFIGARLLLVCPDIYTEGGTQLGQVWFAAVSREEPGTLSLFALSFFSSFFLLLTLSLTDSVSLVVPRAGRPDSCLRTLVRHEPCRCRLV